MFQFCDSSFFLEILGSKGTPYSGGLFKLEIQLPERLGAYNTLYIISRFHTRGRSDHLVFVRLM